jgi:hypothetical protein
LHTIEEVGAENVVQIITDNAPIYKVAGSIVKGTYPHIFWTSCVVHTLNLALKSICAPKNTPSNEVVYLKCKWISAIAEDGFYINFFYYESLHEIFYVQRICAFDVSFYF